MVRICILLIIISLIKVHFMCITTSRVSVFRTSEDDELHATMHQHSNKALAKQQITSWSTETTFNIKYIDETEITVSSDISPGFFDIDVNGQYSHTCTFRNDHVVEHAVLLNIFKKGSKTRLASSPSSICARSFYDDASFNHLDAGINIQQSKRQKFKRPHSLHIRLMKHKLGW